MEYAFRTQFDVFNYQWTGYLENLKSIELFDTKNENYLKCKIILLNGQSAYALFKIDQMRNIFTGIDSEKTINNSSVDSFKRQNVTNTDKVIADFFISCTFKMGPKESN